MNFFISIGLIFITFTIQAQTRLLSIVSQDWNNSNNSWVNTWHENRVYNSEGKYTARINEKYLAEDKKWIRWNKFENEFDSKTGYINQVNGFGYKNDEQDFIQGKTQYIYDEFNRYQQNIDYSLNTQTNDWTPNTKGFNLYDAKNRIVVNTGYKYNATIKDYELYSRTEYSFNDDNKYTYYIAYVWNNEKKFWQNKSKMIYNYTSFGEIQSTLLQTYNETTNQWQNSKLNTQEYNESKQLVVSNEQTWNNETKQWQWTQKTLQDYYKDGFTEQLTLYLFDNNTKTWNKKSRSVFYYEFTPIVNSKQNAFTFDIYPNPTQGIVQIQSTSTNQIKEVFVYNTTGKRIYYNTKIESINLSEFPNGIYFINVITNNNETIVKKINVIH